MKKVITTFQFAVYDDALSENEHRESPSYIQELLRLIADKRDTANIGDIIQSKV